MENKTFSVIVPWVPREFQTQWHPTQQTGPFARLVRGEFKTFSGAVEWASRNLGRGPYEIRENILIDLANRNETK